MESKIRFVQIARHVQMVNRKLAAVAEPTTQLVKSAKHVVRENTGLAAAVASKILFVRTVQLVQAVNRRLAAVV